MSEAAPAGNTSRPKGSFRRRKPSGKGPRAAKPTEEGASPATPTETEAAPKRERPETVPVPEELLGSTQTGTVVVTVRNRKFHFGFISLATCDKAEDVTVPRIYYNPSCIGETDLHLYRGYEVTFEVSKDENGRFCAKNIALTENGKKIKETRDAESEERRKVRAEERAVAAAAAAAKKEAAAAAKKEREAAAAAAKKEKEAASPKEGEEGAAKKKRRNRKKSAKKPAAEGDAAAAPAPAAATTEKKPPRERRSATFEITVEGDASKTGSVTFPISQSIGRLKSIATKAVEAPTDLSVYLITAEHPTGVFLTRAVLNGVTESGKLLLAPKREADNLENQK